MSLARMLVTVVVGLLVCSCSFDRSGHPVIGEVVGKRLTTKRPTVLAWGSTLRGGPFLLDSSRRMLRLHDEAEYERHADLMGPVVVRLPVGTRVRVDEVHAFLGDGDSVLTAFGVIGEGDGTWEFYYPMGYSGGMRVAPWEPPLRPGQRRFDVGYEVVE